MIANKKLYKKMRGKIVCTDRVKKMKGKNGGVKQTI